MFPPIHLSVKKRCFSHNDYANINALKSGSLNLRPIYQKCKEIMKGNQKGNETFLYKKEFKEMIDKADERNIWAYKGLTLKYVPYVLLVNYRVFSKKDLRKRKVHFVFDSLMSNYDDLWINSKVKQSIWRVYPDEQNSVERGGYKIFIDLERDLLMKEIDKYMFIQEAAIRWGIPYETVKNKVKPFLSSRHVLSLKL